MDPNRSGLTGIADAAAQDAAGRHDEAVNVLARATQAGDLDCMTLLGKRLLTGDHAPLLVQQGAGLVIEAAGKGQVEAAVCAATLCGLGYGVARDWTQARRWYEQAAARGWASAQQALATPDFAAPLPAAAPVQEFTAPAGTTLNESPLLRMFPAFISAALCDWVIGRSRHRLERARIYDAVARRETIAATRSNTTAVFKLLDAELPDLLIQARMSAACGVPVRQFEAPAVLHYDVGEQITDHYDFVNPQIPGYEAELRRNGQRVITFLVYLNDGYEGGETGFPRLGIEHHGVKGSALYFVNALPGGEPDLRTLHAGRPPRSGEKWIISQFIRGHAVIAAGG